MLVTETIGGISAAKLENPGGGDAGGGGGTIWLARMPAAWLPCVVTEVETMVMSTGPPALMPRALLPRVTIVPLVTETAAPPSLDRVPVPADIARMPIESSPVVSTAMLST